MCKLRIKRWNLRKNFRMDGLGAVATTVQPLIEAGFTPPTAIVNDRKVPIERVRRHFGSALRISDVSTAADRGHILRQSTSAEIPSGRSHHGGIPRVLFQQSNQMHALESTLIQLNNYYDWRITVPDDHFIDKSLAINDLSDYYRASTETGAVFCGLSSADTASVQIELCFNMTKIVLREQHVYLFPILVDILSVIRLFPGTASRIVVGIFGCLRRFAKRILSESHPISMLLSLILHP